MKIKKILIAALAAANILSVGTGLVLTAVGSSAAHKQGTNYAAQRWDSEGEHVQLSCYFTEDAGFTTGSYPFVRQMLADKLKNAGVIAEEGQKFIPEAYSVNLGQHSVRCDRTGRSEAMVTAVGGDFFLFRDFKLLDGSFFSEADLMQDGAVIDRNLAWELYGSDDIAGMNIYINGVKFYISGVIDLPATKAEKKTAGDFSRAYISYDGIKLLEGGMYDPAFEQNITCYECIVPNPVENFAYNAVSEYFKNGYTYTSAVVNNTERFKPSELAKKYKKLSDYAIADKAIIYPYWENASRITEFRLAGIYYFRRLTYIIPILTLLLLIVIGWRTGGRLRRKITSKISDTVTKILYRRSIIKKEKKEQKEQQKISQQSKE